MTRSFFQRLESTNVDYLLISGQATILYGAATFSEDVDLWVRPSSANLDRFVVALRAESAHYHKLTPRFDLGNLERGHGFHFVLPPDSDGPEVYLDVMGKPPRVSDFESALEHARTFDTDLGRIPTVGIRELVELKKTQRAADYPIIGRLALAYLDDPNAHRTETDLRWALDNVFGLPELRPMLRSHAAALRTLVPALPEPLGAAVAELAVSEDFSTALEDELEIYFDARSAVLRRADRQYWHAIIGELRALRREGSLMTEGAGV